MADMLSPELGGLSRESDTNHSVPGRLRGRQAKYEEIGAEPYIVASEFWWLVVCRTCYICLTQTLCSHSRWLQVGV